MSSARTWSDVRHVLAIRTDDIGGVLMTTPALRAVRRHLPDARITMLTSPASAPAAALVPEIDDVIAWDAPWTTDEPVEPASLRRQTEIISERGIDAAIVFTRYTQSAAPGALLAHQAGIPRRLAHSREHLHGLVTDWVRDPEPTERIRHEVDRQLALVGTVGMHTDDTRLSLAVPADARMRLRRRFAENDVDPARPWIAVHPGASEDIRRYPADQLIEVIRQIRSVTGCRVVLTGSAEERDLTGEIARSSGSGGIVDLAGQLELEELAALIAHAPLLITNNSGPSHIAAAVGTRAVVLYARTHPQHVPWRIPSRVLYFDFPPCDTCTHELCRTASRRFRMVDAQTVTKAALDLLGVVPWKPPAQLEALAY